MQDTSARSKESWVRGSAWRCPLGKAGLGTRIDWKVKGGSGMTVLGVGSGTLKLGVVEGPNGNMVMIGLRGEGVSIGEVAVGWARGY